jgi:hypothetical protein
MCIIALLPRNSWRHGGRPVDEETSRIAEREFTIREADSQCDHLLYERGEKRLFEVFAQEMEMQKIKRHPLFPWHCSDRPLVRRLMHNHSLNCGNVPEGIVSPSSRIFF